VVLGRAGESWRKLERSRGLGDIQLTRSLPHHAHRHTTRTADARARHTVVKRDIFTNIASMDAALAELESGDNRSISEAARKHGVGRSALSRRFNHKATSKAQHHYSTRLLNNAQEKELLKYIRRLCERCLPPTPKMLASIAQELCGKKPSKNWVARFVARHRAQLDARYLNTLDLARHKADSRASYEHYFDVLSARIKEYDILPENMYNMDEKGFLIGRFRVSSKQACSRTLFVWTLTNTRTGL
jgi:transposase-like protein